MLELGPGLFDELDARQPVGNRAPAIYSKGGLSSSEIAAIEAQLGFPLPDDRKYLLANVQDPGETLWPWARFEREEYDRSIAWVRDGIEFDVEQNALWLDRWGKHPDSLAGAIDIVRRDFGS